MSSELMSIYNLMDLAVRINEKGRDSGEGYLQDWAEEILLEIGVPHRREPETGKLVKENGHRGLPDLYLEDVIRLNVEATNQTALDNITRDLEEKYAEFLEDVGNDWHEEAHSFLEEAAGEDESYFDETIEDVGR